MKYVGYDKKTKRYVTKDDEFSAWQNATKDEVLEAVFDGLQECVETNSALSVEFKEQYSNIMQKILLEEDNCDRTYRALAGLTRGLLSLAVSHNGSNKYHKDRWSDLEKQVKEMWVTMVVYLNSHPAAGRSRALFNFFSDYALSLHVSYGDFDGLALFKEIRKSLLTLDDEATHAYWSCATDEFNYTRNVKGGRNTSPWNMTAYFAKRGLTMNPGNEDMLRYISEFSIYSRALHRVTEVYPDCLSLKFKHDGSRRTYIAPADSNDVPLSEAKSILLGLAEDKDTHPLIRYASYGWLGSIASPLKAYSISRKQEKIARKAKDIRTIQNIDDYATKGRAMAKGITINAITVAIFVAIFFGLKYWWESELSRGFKNFWGGIGGLAVGALIFIMLAGYAMRNVNGPVYMVGVGPGGNTSIFFFY